MNGVAGTWREFAVRRVVVSFAEDEPCAEFQGWNEGEVIRACRPCEFFNNGLADVSQLIPFANNFPEPKMIVSAHVDAAGLASTVSQEWRGG